MKTLFLVNTASGSQRGAALIKQIVSLNEDRSHGIEAIEIDWVNLDQQLRDLPHYTLIVLAGGDGTVSSLAPRLLDSCKKLAIYPLGTGNDLAIELGFSKLWIIGLEHAVEMLLSRPIRHMSTWEVVDAKTEKPLFTFVNYASLGFSAEVVKSFTLQRHLWQRLGRFGNRLGYLLIAIAHLFCSKLPHLYLTDLHGEFNMHLPPEAGRCLIFLNISSVMGLGRCPIRVDAGSDILSAVIIRTIWNYLAMVINKAVSLTNIFPSATGTILLPSRQWHISGIKPGTAIQIDGEAQMLYTTEIIVQGSKVVPMVDLR